MALPADLPTSTLTFGPYPDGVGTVSLVGLKGKIVPVHPTTLRPVRLVHIESGAAIVPKPVEVEIGNDSTATVGPLPRQGSGKLSPDNFLWSVEWHVSSSAPSPGNRFVALPLDSENAVDFDKLGAVASAPAVYVPIGVGPQGDPGPEGPAGPPSPPSGAAGGALSGSYPNPGLNSAAVIAVVDGADEVTPTGSWDFTGAVVTGIDSGGGPVSDATTTTKGIVELATVDEAASGGADETRAVTPAGVTAAVASRAASAVTSMWYEAQGSVDASGFTAPIALVWQLAGNLNLTGIPQGRGSATSTTAYICLRQASAGGPYAVTWPGSLVWMGGATAPEMPSSPGAELIVMLLWTGEAWRATVLG